MYVLYSILFIFILLENFERIIIVIRNKDIR